MRGTFGIGAYLIPVLLIALGVMLIMLKKPKIDYIKVFMTAFMALSVIGLIHICFSWFVPVGTAKTAGDFSSAVSQAYEQGITNIGLGGFAVLYVYPLTALVSDIGAFFVFFAFIVICLIVLFNMSLKDTGEKVSQSVKNTGEKISKGFKYVKLRHNQKKEKVYDYDIIDVDDIGVEDISIPEEFEVTEAKPVERKRKKPVVKEYDDFGVELEDENQEVTIKEAEAEVLNQAFDVYEAPPTKLLNLPPASKRTSTDHSEKINMMESTLESFGIKAWVENITIGPAITRYELSIERGTRVSKILNLADDIALSMAATNVRIEAPIPGKSAIGIEIPNDTVSMVTLREVLEGDIFKEHKSPVAVGLGKDITGTTIVADLAKMPHLLIAGQTGAGKSVCINSIITSLLYKSSPKDVKLILIDPKMVELNVYNGIPHLMTPVVTDPKKAAGALQFVVREMEKRYETFAKRKVKDIYRFNEVAQEAGEEKMPRIVVIVDELNDLMLVARGEVEDSVMRIAQLARAAGIYLILATQRPSVNVITGVIKANIPSRIAFAVASGVDSKTILDSTGAEKLVGRGDMLLHISGDNKPTRVQGAFVGEQEIEKVVEFIKSKNATAQYIGEEQLVMRELKPNHGGSGENPNDYDATDDEDELFPAAVEYAIECGNISISALQRRFKVGYARAGRLIDSMELKGVVEAQQGAKARKVLMTREQFWSSYDERLD
ncbi:MAG: DNA translocase FtsK [Clostridiales bacterium]|nr:DNA translocase FtsK [Clostridiales bacterium]